MKKQLLLILALCLSFSELLANKEPMMLIKCETHKDFMKYGEELVASDKNANEMMFLVPTNEKGTGNLLDDSIGYFVHNKNKENGSFSMLIWLEKEKVCLVFAGMASKLDGHKFFENRNKVLKIVEKYKK